MRIVLVAICLLFWFSTPYLSEWLTSIWIKERLRKGEDLNLYK